MRCKTIQIKLRDGQIRGIKSKMLTCTALNGPLGEKGFGILK